MFSNVCPVGSKNLSLDLEELVQKYQVKIQGLIHIGAHYGQEYELNQKLGVELHQSRFANDLRIQ